MAFPAECVDAAGVEDAIGFDRIVFHIHMFHAGAVASLAAHLDFCMSGSLVLGNNIHVAKKARIREVLPHACTRKQVSDQNDNNGIEH